jgi:hypothetical protein
VSAEQMDETVPWCPSARPDPGSVVFAVRTADPDRPGVMYLSETVEAVAGTLALADPVDPREVFRFAAPCATNGCAHFSGSRCSLVTRIVEQFPASVAAPPPCRLRPRCRWYAEEGTAACIRCPAIVTLQPHPDPTTAAAAAPDLRLAGQGQNPIAADETPRRRIPLTVVPHATPAIGAPSTQPPCTRSGG